MKKLITILTVLFLIGFANLSISKGIKDNVKSEAETKQFTNYIDIGKNIFGIPFGTSEEQVMKDYGKPYGYIRFNKHVTAMIYNSSSALLFSDNKLSGVRISSSILDYELAEILPQKQYHNAPWQLSNGIKYEMTLTEVKKILGDKLSGDQHGYKWSYQTESISLSLNFARYQGEEGDNAYRLNAITLEKK